MPHLKPACAATSAAGVAGVVGGAAALPLYELHWPGKVQAGQEAPVSEGPFHCEYDHSWPQHIPRLDLGVAKSEQVAGKSEQVAGTSEQVAGKSEVKGSKE